ncbi:hypothetical protein Nepgr_018159 [Nepenthes gracilis]|uniref:Uncharacterized protein n=1 Tax=Nepenthes gracilis TaxID=150966 RepID=A0AAD3XT79_NEPGR|nr:hypothetical protein Nepgr_018159 [Nepenthes gracilis]
MAARPVWVLSSRTRKHSGAASLTKPAYSSSLGPKALCLSSRTQKHSGVQILSNPILFDLILSDLVCFELILSGQWQHVSMILSSLILSGHRRSLTYGSSTLARCTSSLIYSGRKQHFDQ